jgi:hypothetical protein
LPSSSGTTWSPTAIVYLPGGTPLRHAGDPADKRAVLGEDPARDWAASRR